MDLTTPFTHIEDLKIILYDLTTGTKARNFHLIRRL